MVAENKTKEKIEKDPKKSREGQGETEKEYHQRLRIKIRAYDHKIADQAARTIIEISQQSGVKIIGPIPLPTEKRKYTVLRSTFVHKNSREQYERQIHKRLIDIIDPVPKTIEDLASLNLPAGADIEIKM